MKFVCYSDWGRLPESANELFAEGAKKSIFYSRAWFENVSAALDKDQYWLLACVLDEGKILAILPLVSSGEANWQSLKHRYATHYSLLLASSAQQAVLACLVEGLNQIPCKSLLLEPVSDEDGGLVQLQQVMESAGYRCDHAFRLYNWINRLQGQSYADYMAARPARVRNTISRKKRKLARDHGYRIRLFVGGDVPDAMSDYYLVYNASWKANEQYVRFLDGVVADFSGAGWARLAVLYVNTQPVAAQLWFVHQGKANIFRLAYDEKWRQYSPGSILTEFLMEYVINNDGVEEIDFLTGNEAYKQDWMSERRERYVLSCIRNAKPASRCWQYIESLRRNLLQS